jgi:hypothetical protein
MELNESIEQMAALKTLVQHLELKIRNIEEENRLLKIRMQTMEDLGGPTHNQAPAQDGIHKITELVTLIAELTNTQHQNKQQDNSYQYENVLFEQRRMMWKMQEMQTSMEFLESTARNNKWHHRKPHKFGYKKRYYNQEWDRPEVYEYDHAPPQKRYYEYSHAAPPRNNMAQHNVGRMTEENAPTANPRPRLNQAVPRTGTPPAMDTMTPTVNLETRPRTINPAMNKNNLTGLHDSTPPTMVTTAPAGINNKTTGPVPTIDITQPNSDTTVARGTALILDITPPSNGTSPPAPYQDKTPTHFLEISRKPRIWPLMSY